ncbi:hypothetical protein [Aliarcobacter sp.]|uniref:hypothetical protein n=1 Tax=Aliarcobacter sp. TaxID=2321116 RepID=UPI00356472F4
MNKKSFFSKFASSAFMIIGLIFLIVYLLIPENAHPIFDILRNLSNALGSILIIGGIFEIVFKEKFIKEVTSSFVKTIFLKPASLENFKDEELEQINKSIQSRLLYGNRNNYYSNRILTMINDSFYEMAKGTHHNKDFNTFFQYYNSVLYVNERKENYVNIEYEIKYEIINNTKNKEEVEIDIFSKRFFPLSLSLADSCVTQELTYLNIKSDGKSMDYSKEIRDGKFKEQTLDKDDLDNIRIQEDVKRQIQEDKDGTFSPFKVKFKEKLIVEKKIKIVTLYDDISFSHIFKRPTLNYSIQYHDENVSVNTKDYLTLRFFSGLNKKSSDKIHPVLKGKVISLHVSDGLLLPGEGISIVALRDR